MATENAAEQIERYTDAAISGCSKAQYAKALAAFQGDVNLTMALCEALETYLQDPSTLPVAGIKFGVDTAWLISSGALVFVMHAGFAMVSENLGLCSRRHL